MRRRTCRIRPTPFRSVMGARGFVRGERRTRGSLLCEGVDVFLARAEVAVKGAFEVRFGAREFEDAIGVSLEVGRWVETAVEEHLPASLIAAVALAAVKRMLNCAVGKSQLTVDLESRASRPRGNRILIAVAYTRRHRGFVSANHAKGHMIVAGAHGANFEEPANVVKHTPLPAPCVARMRVDVIAAVEGPEGGAGRNHRLASAPDRGEALVRLHVLVMGT